MESTKCHLIFFYQTDCTLGEDVIDRQSTLGDDITIVMTHEGSPCDGEVTAWEFWAEQPGTFRAFIARPDAGGESNKFTVVGFNDITVTSAMVGQKTTITDFSRIAVQTGDMIGVGNFDSANNPILQATSFGGYSFDYANMDPSGLVAGGTLTIQYSAVATISISAVISPGKV